MLFNSLSFLIFFPTVLILYFALPQKYRWALLLAASYYFYASWKLEYLLLIILSTGVDYTLSLRMGRLPTKKARRPYLLASLFVNLGILFAFKYFNFFNESVRAVFDQFNIFYGVPAFDVLLPVGISFYTFQTLSYSIEVYQGKQEPERHLGIFALYVSFFPQLVAGPIERASTLLPQFYKTHRFEVERISEGLRLMLWGFFKKLVIADNVAVVVNQIYNNVGDFSGPDYWIATFLFAFQIYCDFSGYSDIAIGTARILGFRLMKNFNSPYQANSISDFWGRWHISLSTWFRDYLYIPLGGNRVVKSRWFFNLFVTFLVSGLWHGANWTFVIWGALNGFYLIVAIVLAVPKKRLITAVSLHKAPRLLNLLNIGGTFLLICFAWIFFRANSISDALFVVSNLATGFGTVAADPLGFVRQLPAAYGVTMNQFILMLLMIGVLMLTEIWQGKTETEKLLKRQPLWLQWSAYYVVIALIFLFGNFNVQEFIYFQF